MINMSSLTKFATIILSSKAKKPFDNDFICAEITSRGVRADLDSVIDAGILRKEQG